MKNTIKTNAIRSMALIAFIAVIGLSNAFARGGSERSSSAGSGALDSLLRKATRTEKQDWGEGRIMTVYSFNPEIKDELIQVVKDAGFDQTWEGEYERDWDLQDGVLRWCVSPDLERWGNEIQYSAVGETRVHNYGFVPIPTSPNSDGVHKIIRITGYNPQGGVTVYSMQIQSESKAPTSWPPAAVAVHEIDGQTITFKLSLWQWRWDNLTPWTGTGKFFIVIDCHPPRNRSRDGSKYIYSLDGINPTPIDIQSEIMTLEWSKFMWFEDYTAG